ncbi:hypothetical protein K402DRAFT_320962 [Aulographum hederae CBS 113979]|uniref:Efflux pump dotC n=1 Tax=Aulographum hederae CBS 113979 TaxID=1176131 RepID=A0A6G1HHS2_9PEZI|nr:hypothetical protein K402DRAFT_320962 [Aulographum hederae CBS 113979]
MASSLKTSENAADAPPPDYGHATSNASKSPPAAGGPPGPPGGEAPEDKLTRAQIAIIMSALCMAVFLAALDVTIVTTALPTISEHFQSSSGYTWIGSAFLLASSASTPVWGKVSDIWGRKPILLLANLVFLVGSLICALSISIGMMIAGRSIQGVGGGGLLVLVNITISDLFSPRSRGAYFGMIGGVWALASSLGPIIGGAFTEKVTWRWCFYINLPLDGAAFLIILFFLKLDTPKTPFVEGIKSVDWLGALAIVGGTLMLLFGLEFGGVSYPWASAIVICLIVFGIVTMALFFVIEWKVATLPIMPLPLFKRRSNIASLLVCFLHGIVFISGSYYLPLYFQAVLGATPLLSGVYTLAFAVPLSFASVGTGIFIKKTGNYLPPIWFGLFFMTLGFGLYINLGAQPNWAKIIIFQMIAGIGTGPNFQAPLIALQSLVEPRDIATATATFAFTRNLATSISVVIGGVIFQNEMVSKSSTLVAALGPQLAAQLGGGSAGANVQVVDSLPPQQQTVARQAFTESLRTMWIAYTAIAFCGLLVGLLVKQNTLSRAHQMHKPGMEGERERMREAKEGKKESSAGIGDVEAGRPDLKKSNEKEDSEVPQVAAAGPDKTEVR